MKILAFCSKSGVGKSTLINRIANELKRTTHVVKSLSTREPRDKFDQTTHTFVSNDYYEAHKGDIISVYHAPQGYHNWTDKSCFVEGKINLYAIDSIALNNEFLPKCKEFGWELDVIYLDIPEEVRKKRYIKREGNLQGFSEEKHLSAKYLTHFPYRKVIDANRNIDEIMNDAVEVLEAFLEK